MRHHAATKALLCLSLLTASYAWADEAADRMAVDRTIAALNEVPQRAPVFTADAYSELDHLPDVQPQAFRIAGPARTDSGMVTISHEPWGEAALNFPGTASLPTLEILNPRIASGATRFVTPDVAVTDGVWTYKDNAGATQTIPLLFVMKREGNNWKIASLRVLAPR